MDLMGDIGAADQLMSARVENKVLKAKVEELKEQLQEFKLTNAQLLAEVEMYRREMPVSNFSNLALGREEEEQTKKGNEECFVSSGDGTYPSDPAVSLPNLHGFSNPLCCALDHTDTIVATGGADGHVSVAAWGAALAPGEEASRMTVQQAARVQCSAPIICIRFSGAFAPTSSIGGIIAVGCMDATVHLIGYKQQVGRIQAWKLNIHRSSGSGDDELFMKYHTKYVKSIDWAPGGVLASSSADGTVHISKISLTFGGDGDGDGTMDIDGLENGSECTKVNVETIKSLHLKGAVEAVCFVGGGDTLCIYERDTCYLSYFDLKEDFKMSKFSLNGAVTGGFDSHVSFAVMHLSLSPNGDYICAATDTSRNIILQVKSNRIIRDLYGHKNDGFSQPRIAWSSSGQYIFGNTQEDSSICVWDIASAKLVMRLEGHTGQLRDIFSSKVSDTVVTSSYDKTVKIWLNGVM